MLKTLLRKTAKYLLILMLLSLLPVLALRWMDPPGSMLMLERQWQARSAGTPLSLQHQWVAYRQLPDSLKMAVIAAEDQHFATHHGFDLPAIRAALSHNRSGGRLRGASTISQQTAKNMFLWSGRSWPRKALESWFTLWIELLWPKQRILEVYLNIVEWDHGVFGAEAAARRHFGTGASYLSDRQAALLAAVLPNPRQWSASQPSTHVRQRAEWILRQSQQLGGAHYLRQLERRWRAEDWLKWLRPSHWLGLAKD